jgi:hypothetical protein
MWIHRHLSDSPNNISNRVWPRRFITGKIITETITSSNYKEIIEVPITFVHPNGNDELLLQFNDGTSHKETYHRLNRAD